MPSPRTTWRMTGDDSRRMVTQTRSEESRRVEELKRKRLRKNKGGVKPPSRESIRLARFAPLGAKEIAGDDGALDFGSTFVNGEDASIPVHAFDVGFAGIAEGAVDLDRFVDDAIGHFAGV